MLEWVGLHDLRHFRATQWVKHGVDLRTVQHLLGHASIPTTMRYAHFAPNHAIRSINGVEVMELQELESERGTPGPLAGFGRTDVCTFDLPAVGGN